LIKHIDPSYEFSEQIANCAEVVVNARIVIGALCVCIAGCATAPQQAMEANEHEEADAEVYIAETYCSPAFTAESTTVSDSESEAASPPNEILFAEFPMLSPASRRIAEVIRVDDLLAQIPSLEDEVVRNRPGARLRLLELRQELSDKLLLALFDASSVAAELECEKGRADAIAAGLEEQQTDIQQRRTVIALLADATAGLLSGFFLFGGSEVLAGGADIIGNVLQGSYGYAALGGQQQYELRLSRNLLQEVWEGPEKSAMFPESVWRFLKSGPVQQRRLSRRDLIVQEWKKRLGDAGTETQERRKALFFGEGGVYSGNELRHRAEMLDRLKASVRLMSQELNLLFKESLVHLSGMTRMAGTGRDAVMD
jgi:hypothetical protein